MISSSSRIRSSLPARGKTFQGFVCLQCASSLWCKSTRPLLSVFPAVRPSSQPQHRRYASDRAPTSAYRPFQDPGISYHPFEDPTGEVEALYGKPEVEDRTARIVRQENTIGRKDDIRSYLKKWRPETKSANIDPITVPDENAPLPKSPFLKGNMLGDDVIHESKDQELARLMKLHDIYIDEDNHNPFLKPGDIVLLQQDGTFSDGQLAVYVRSVNEQQQFYTIRGKWRASNPSDANYTTDERIPTELLAPILPYLPKLSVAKSALPSFAMEGGVPRPLGAPILSIMNEMEEEGQKFFGEHTKVFNNIYEFLADEKEPLTMTLDEIATKILGRDPGSLSIAERLVIHKAVKRHTFYIVPNQSSSAIESYTIRPKQQTKQINNVLKWVREYLTSQARAASGRRLKHDTRVTPFGRFVRKARKLVQQSRAHRKPTRSYALGPFSKHHPPDESLSEEPLFPDEGLGEEPFPPDESLSEEPLPPDESLSEEPLSHNESLCENIESDILLEPFTETDQAIIDYMRLWVLPPLLMADGKLRSAGPIILKSIKMYDRFQHDQSTGYLFLQEIGILRPWENIHLLSEQLALPGHGVSSVSDEIVKESENFCEQLTPDTLVDSMKHLRKDWGDLKVFCVDSPSAAEIDDGISFEPVPGSNDTFWIHIHVANPSAFISGDHPLAKRAAHFKRSFYSPERIYPMFPPIFTHTYFSLAPNKPTITFSAKINSEGDILETDVTNGVIHNVVYITPDRVRQLFGIDHNSVPEIVLNVGDPLEGPNRPEIQEDISDEDQETLKSLEATLDARRAQRVKKGALEFISHQRSQPVVSAGEEKINAYTGDHSQGYHSFRDPSIGISGRRTDPYEIPKPTKHDIVSHAMQLGGEIAGKWCKDRGIPLIFSGTAQRPGHSVTPVNESEHFARSQFPRGFSSSKPTPHVSMGMDQYTKCTSPLRRYSDLLAHWQIEAALRHEAELKCQFSPDQDKAILPYSEQDVNAIIARSNWQNKLVDRAQARSRDFWTLQLLFRGHFLNQAELPHTFECVITTELAESGGPSRHGEPQYIAELLPFRVRCFVSVDEYMPPLRPGDLVEADLSHINLYAVLMNVMAFRLITRPDAKKATVPLGFVR